ncbi:cation:proton antiporter [Arhodomonas aquaeolei]|uniref:cation:proton antiporter n=1 Tax=Arhodomonas aquaeolei TaxID=2369 RepID=UPI00037D4A9F|nr:cation:proton antiporter [Arhodomonas aquaeolei]
MSEALQAADLNALLVLLIGVATAAAMGLRAGCERLGLPPLVGYLLLGVAISSVDQGLPVLSDPVIEGFDLLANLGLVALLFRVGLGLDPRTLLAKLPGASVVWVGDVTVSGLIGFATAHWLLGLALIPSLIIGVALTATSIGVVMPVWQDADALDGEAGSLTVDVAELDDISGVMLMAVLFAVLPVLQSGNGALWGSLASAAGGLAVRFAGFAVLCWLFARFAEPALHQFLQRWENPPERLLTVVGVGSAIAAVAGVLGFSLAIGALFAGLVFSAFPERVQSQNTYHALYDFLTPYFFIGIGLKFNPTLLLPALGIGAVLVVAAAAGKLAGPYLAARLTTDRDSARLLAVSMVPRAEIAMVVIHQAHALGPWAISDHLYGAMAVVSLVTCVVTPPLLGRMLARRRDSRA